MRTKGTVKWLNASCAPTQIDLDASTRDAR